MPAILAMLGGMLINITGSIVGQVLVALGIGVATYTGIDITLDWLKAQAVSNFQVLDPRIVGMLGVLKVGECISIVTSAMLARATINGVQSGTFKRWVKV